MSHVKRIFVEKKAGLDIAAKNLFRDLRDNLGIKALTAVRLLNRYDVEGISGSEYAAVRDIVFAEPPVDSSMRIRSPRPPNGCLPSNTFPDSTTSAPTPPRSASRSSRTAGAGRRLRVGCGALGRY